MSIEIFQGTPGSGKSYGAVYRIVECLMQGKTVVANINLVSGWSQKLARRSFEGLWRDRSELASLYRSRYIVSSDPQEISRIRLRGRGESRGLIVLDECHLIFNSRDWRNSMQWIKFFSQHRKLGWDVLLVSQNVDAIDTQIRYLAEFHTSIRNLRKMRIPILGLPLSPWPMFLCVRCYAGKGPGSGVRESVNLIPFFPTIASFYDSMQLHDMDDEPEPHEDPLPPVRKHVLGDDFRDFCTALAAI